MHSVILRMRCEFSDATKLIIVHEHPGRLEQLVAWTAEWGFDPAASETAADVLDEISVMRLPWLGLFSAGAWQACGRSVISLAEALIGSAPGFCTVIAAPGSPRPTTVSGDYLAEPFEPQELQARLNLANRIVCLQRDRQLQAEQLESARTQLRKLEGMFPICMDCKKIRDERNRWQPIEHYIAARTKAAFTHGLCPSCFQRRIEELQPVG